ncbi:ComEA family DNA-binding protein [Curtanaerobium respiraculi]|uniref:ComEA family DNA-binding protein n=1 Tax=Curtanaerobium respiraculi TaxID=2949669 RepID=UPI0024B3AEEE|nr:ComEA family DNA-binding protein [Curtanaerobium respiraculi]
MPFIDSAETVRLKLRLPQVSIPLLVGLSALAIAIAAIAVLNLANFATGDDFAIERRGGALAAAEGAQGDCSAVAMISVYLTGCVGSPGVYEVPEGSRVADAIECAGGLADDAAPESINLARKVVDGEHVSIPAQGQADAADESEASGSDGGGGGSPSGSLVNINTASQAELESLPGIGPSTAARIVANRADEGPFIQKDDLKRISGIGDKKYAALEDLICV